MTEFETILEANCKPPKTKRKAKPLDDKESLFLSKVRNIKHYIYSGHKTLVVVDNMREFHDIFLHYTPTMKLLSKTGLLFVKTLDMVTASDLEMKIVELGNGE